jgi:hypothetical protein
VGWIVRPFYSVRPDLGTNLHTAAGEACHEWWSWSHSFGIKSIFVQSILQCSVYVVLAVSGVLFFLASYVVRA